MAEFQDSGGVGWGQGNALGESIISLPWKTWKRYQVPPEFTEATGFQSRVSGDS